MLQSCLIFCVCSCSGHTCSCPLSSSSPRAALVRRLFPICLIRLETRMPRQLYGGAISCSIPANYVDAR